MPVSRDTQVGGGQVTEYISSVFPFPVVQALGKAGEGRVLLCDTELSLTPSELSALREFVTRLNASSER
jgi:hypothetical protein